MRCAVAPNRPGHCRSGDRRWSPLHETYAEFLRHIEVEPVLMWNEDRVRGSHAQFSPWLMHHLLAPPDIRFIGLERLRQLTAVLTGSHTADQSTPLARLVGKLDQESVEQAAPEWMIKRPDSKVNQIIRALRDLISDGRLSVNTPGAPVYVTGDKAAVVVPLSISAARDFLKRENNLKLPSNYRPYDLLAQAEVVEADGNRQCVKRIRVPGKRGPAELSALIFNRDTIIPHGILPTLPKVTFDLMPDCRVLHVRRSIWRGQEQQPKTANALRAVDIPEVLGRELRNFVGGVNGYLFATAQGRPLQQRNVLRVLHSVKRVGFHAFRRFRLTWLRKNAVPKDLERFWMGHAAEEVGDLYSKLKEDVVFRQEWAERIGLGFELIHNGHKTCFR